MMAVICFLCNLPAKLLTFCIDIFAGNFDSALALSNYVFLKYCNGQVVSVKHNGTACLMGAIEAG